GDAIVLKGTIFPGEYRFVLKAVYTGRDPTTDEGRFFFHWDYINETMKNNFPERADPVGWFLSQIAAPELAGPVAEKIDGLFKNSLAETITESEAAFQMGFVSMTEALLLAIQVVSWLVIIVILVLLANTMAMNARERLGEYAVLKTMGYRPHHLVGLIMGESMTLAVLGGLLGLALTFPMVHLFKVKLGQYFRIFPLTDTTLVLGFIIALGVGVLAGILPAWRASRVGIAEALRRVG
ncbi:MAG: ABC transporter permease, partial [Desulfobaccales bacterium]